MYWPFVPARPGPMNIATSPWGSARAFAVDEALTSSPQRAAAPDRQHAIDDLLYRESGRIDHRGIGRGFEGTDRTGRIPQIPLGYLPRKGGKANIGPLVFQLLMAPQGSFSGARGEEYLKARLREHDRTHVAAVGHQPRGAREGMLTSEQSRTDFGPGRDPGSALPRDLRPQLMRDVLAFQNDALAPIVIRVEADVHRGGQRCVSGDIAGLQPLFQSPESDQSVQGAAVEQVPAQMTGHGAADRALTGAAG